MAGPGHQFPGGFSNNPGAMRNSFGGGPMGSQMTSPIPNQLGGVMSNQINTGAGMAGMNSQMVQSYGPGMQSQMNSMGMAQAMPGSNSQSPVPSAMGMGPGMVGSAGMVTGMGPSMANSVMSNSMGVPNTNMATGALSNNPAIASNMTGTVNMVNPTVNTVVSNVQTGNVINQTNTVAQPQQSKEFNTASLCRFGQETVQDIVSRTQEVFQTLKAIQPPNGTSQGLVASNEKKAKVQEQLRTIRLLFKRLRLIFEKCNENCQVPGMEYTHIESLIPLKDEYEHNKIIDEKKTSEAYKTVCEENRELTEQMVLKNKQLKEVINNLRTIIWEINVMLNMRRS